ncbi:MAG: NAD(P)-dependent oxidoreductase [Patescibacteria group bacterium]
MQIGILEKKDFSPEALDMLRTIGDISLYSEGDLGQFISSKEVIFIRIKHFWDKEMFAKAKRLKYLCTPTTGLNHIDLAEAEKRGVKIISLKGEYDFTGTIAATPEHTFGLTLALLRNYKEAFLSEKNKEWDRDQYKGHEIKDNKVGIIGFGRVGRMIAGYFKTFGAEVFFFDADQEKQPLNGETKCLSVGELISGSNIIILAASYSEGNNKFIGKKEFDLMADKYFINTARGELVDEDYLLDRIEAGAFAGVAVDVITRENHQNNLERWLSLVNNRNLIITPHIAGATYESMEKTEIFVANQLIKQIEK